MALSNFVPTIWSRNLNISLRTKSRGLSVTNQDYEGEIRNGGDTVKIQRPAAITVGTYTENSNITIQTPTSTTLSLLIDQQDYFAFQVDDVLAVQSNVDLLGPYLDEGNYQIQKDFDTYIFTHVVGGAGSNVITKTAVSASTIYGKIAEAAENLDTNDVPEDNRFMVLSPAEVRLIRESSQFTAASELGDRVKQAGLVGQVLGFDIFMSNNLYSASDGTNTVRHCPYGHRSAWTVASQFSKLETARMELRFADLVKGLHLYGVKVVKANALGDFRITVS